MSTWQDLEIDEKRTILTNISTETGIIENVVEKDWWVSMVLKALFHHTSCADHLVFKGGTSLSKGWSLINRFSEDIDLAIDRAFFGYSGELSKKDRTKLRKASLKYIRETLAEELKANLVGMGIKDFSIELPELIESDKDPEIILVPYQTVLEESEFIGYIPFQIKVEISCRSLREPFDGIMMRSMIANAYPDEEFSEEEFEINTVRPSRTFLEKVFLLHEEFQKHEVRSLRMSRHLYDLEKLMDTDFAKEAMEDTALYVSIVKHRNEFTHNSGVDYKKHHPSTISILPPDSLKEEWEKDYANMRQSFIYGESLDFNALLARISELQERFHNMELEDDFFTE